MTSQCMELCVSAGSRCFFWIAAVIVEIVLKANYIEVNNEQSTTALVMEDIQKEFEISGQSQT